MTYEALTRFAGTWGAVYFAFLFAGVLLYAFWPRNKERFERAARIPLEEEDFDERQ